MGGQLPTGTYCNHQEWIKDSLQHPFTAITEDCGTGKVAVLLQDCPMETLVNPCRTASFCMLGYIPFLLVRSMLLHVWFVRAAWPRAGHGPATGRPRAPDDYPFVQATGRPRAGHGPATGRGDPPKIEGIFRGRF